MDTPRIKNFIILLLLLLNVFLLAITLADFIKNRDNDADERRELIAAVGAMGIYITDENTLKQAPLHSVSLTRNLRAEHAAIDALLGKTSAEDLGGNICHYLGSGGEASFYGSGEFNILFNVGELPVQGSMEKTARRVLKKLRVMADPAYAETETDSGGSMTVTLRCRFGKSPVYNCCVKFTFSQKSLMLVSGTRVLDRQSISVSDSGPDIATALVRFLGEIPKSGKVCSVITGITAGYELRSAVSGESVLVPVWKIETDAGEYTIK